MGAPGSRWLSKQQQGAWRAYILGTTLLLDTLDRELRHAHGLSLGEYEILVRLSETPDRTMRMAQIAESMRHSRSRVTHTVTRMEKAGLISRCTAEGDAVGVAQLAIQGVEQQRRPEDVRAPGALLLLAQPAAPRCAHAPESRTSAAVPQASGDSRACSGMHGRTR